MNFSILEKKIHERGTHDVVELLLQAPVHNIYVKIGLPLDKREVSLRLLNIFRRECQCTGTSICCNFVSPEISLQTVPL